MIFFNFKTRLTWQPWCRTSAARASSFNLLLSLLPSFSPSSSDTPKNRLRPPQQKVKTVAAQKGGKTLLFLGGDVSSFFKIQQLIGALLRIRSIVFPLDLGFLFICYFLLLHFRAIPVPSSLPPLHPPHVVRRSGKEPPFPLPPLLLLPPWCQTGVKVAFLERESEVKNTYEWGEAHITISPFFSTKKLKNHFWKLSVIKHAHWLFPFPCSTFFYSKLYMLSNTGSNNRCCISQFPNSFYFSFFPEYSFQMVPHCSIA